MLWCLTQVRYSGLEAERQTELVEQYAGRLIEGHAGEDFLEELAFAWRMVTAYAGEDAAVRLGRKWLAAEPHEDALPPLLFNLGQLLGDSDDAEVRTEAVGYYERLLEEFPDDRYAPYCEGQVFKIKNLQVGMPAPDFTTEDVDGVEFKLSDYRGKVVLLDFWGFW